MLLALVEKGFTRDEAYAKVQSLAFKSKEEGKDFEEALAEDEGLSGLFTPDEVKDIFDMKYHLKNVDRIFRKAGV